MRQVSHQRLKFSPTVELDQPRPIWALTLGGTWASLTIPAPLSAIS